MSCRERQEDYVMQRKTVGLCHVEKAGLCCVEKDIYIYIHILINHSPFSLAQQKKFVTDVFLSRWEFVQVCT